MRKTIKINNTDYTDAFTPTGLVVSYKKIRGNNSGYMLDGSYVDDVKAVKAVISATCMPTDERILSELLVEISATYVDLYYYDPRLMGYRTIKAMPSETEQAHRGRTCDNLERWTGTAITFTEV